MRIDWESIKKHYTPPEPDQFPIGSRVYIGRQGRGKTLSMVDYAFRVKEEWPDCAIFSNVMLYGIVYKLLEDDEDVARALDYKNGKDGVLVLLDEAHLFFHKSTGIPLEVLTAISQQRKDRRKMIFTSQIWNEMDMSIRKQVDEVVQCRKIGRFQYNTIYDGETVTLNKADYSYAMEKISSELFKHNDEKYGRFDTLQKVVRTEKYSRPAAAPQVAVQRIDRKGRVTNM